MPMMTSFGANNASFHLEAPVMLQASMKVFLLEVFPLISTTAVIVAPQLEPEREDLNNV